MEKIRLQNIDKCAGVPSTRTRQRCTSYSDTDEDKTAQHHWILPFNKIWNGSARTGRRTSRHRLHPLLHYGHNTRHCGILNTGEILNSGESGNQKNGKTKSGGEMVSEDNRRFIFTPAIRKLTADEYCFKCCPSCPEFSFFFAVLHIHQPFFSTGFASRH